MRRLSEWGFAPAPAERLAAVRIFVGAFGLLWVGGRLMESYAVAKLGAAHFKPTGVVRLLDTPLPPSVTLAIGIITCVFLAAFTLGAFYRITAPLAALGVLWALTYRNSFGMIFHTENLLVMHMLALACAPAADAWSIDRARLRAAPPVPEAGYGWILKLLAALTAATYMMAGIAKLRIAGVAWLDGEQLRNQIAVDNLRKALLGDSIAPLATPFLDHPSGFTIFSVMTIVLELGAPLVLLHPRAAKLWALGAWGFHVGVVFLMNIWFPYPLLGLAYLPLLRCERPFDWVIGWWRRWRAKRAGPRAGNVPPPTPG